MIELQEAEDGILSIETKSPFPGMDPYLEPHWQDLHGALVPYLRDAVDDALPDQLVS